MSTKNQQQLGLTISLSTELATQLKKGRETQLELQRSVNKKSTSQIKQHQTTASVLSSSGGHSFQDDGEKNDDKNNNNCDQTRQPFLKLPTSSSSSSLIATRTELHNINEDEDRMIMPFVRPKNESDSDNDDDKTLNDHSPFSEDEEKSKKDEDDDDLSPPPCLPVLAIDLEKLLGYKPLEEDEIKRLADDFQHSLIGCGSSSRLKDLNDNDEKRKLTNDKGVVVGEGQQDNDMSGDEVTALTLFTERSEELFESGIAFHSDTLQKCQTDKLGLQTIPYPQFLPLKQQGEEHERSSLMATAKIWKQILLPHRILVVQRVLTHLSNCSRNLIWKYEMSKELRNLANVEDKYQTQQKRKRDLKVWRKETRPAELAKLYEVRENFESRLELARDKYDQLVKEKEDRVQHELHQRLESGIGMGGIAALDWDGKETFAFAPDNEGIREEDDELIEGDLLGSCNDGLDRKITSDDDEDMAGYEHDDYNSSDSEAIQCDNSIKKAEQEEEEEEETTTIAASTVCDTFKDSPSTQTEIVQPKQSISTRIERKNRRAAAASKRMQRKLERERESHRQDQLRQRIKNAHQEEAGVRKMCSTGDEKMALTMITKLEKKLEKVDSLLDVMQEEEWKDQEEGYSLSDEGEDHQSITEQDADENTMSLLDQILAMILGTLPRLDIPMQKHFDRMKEEHQDIVHSWKSTFGRLPCSFAEECQNTNESIPNSSPFDSTRDMNLNTQMEVSAASSLDKNDAEDGIDERIGTDKSSSLPICSQTKNQIKVGSSQSTMSGKKIPDDWEDIDDWDVILPSEVHSTILPGKEEQNITVPMQNLAPPSKLKEKTVKLGLRPGGRVQQ